MRDQICLTTLIVVLTYAADLVKAQLPTYFMDEWCSTTLDLSVQGIEGGRLLLRPPERGMRYLHCYVFLKAPPGRRISLKFKAFDIPSPFDCDRDFLQLYDDALLRTKLTDQLCNSGATPHGTYTSTGVDVAIRVFKRNYMGDQIELLFTAYHELPCTGNEFQCANGKCISKALHCNSYDNCGDGSDICLINQAGLIGAIVAAIVVVIIVAIVIAVLIYRRRQHQRLEKLAVPQDLVVMDAKGHPVVLHSESLHYVDAWDKDLKKRPLSFRSSYSDTSRFSTFKEKLGLHDHDHDDLTPDKSELHGEAGERGGVSNSAYEDETTLKKPPGVLKTSESFKSARSSHKSGSGKESHRIHFGPLKSSTLKKSRSESGLPETASDIYSVPHKPGKKSKLNKTNSSVKYVNEPFFYQPDFLPPTGPEAKAEPPMFEHQGGSFSEGMKGESESRFPIHTLDASTLPRTTQSSLSRSLPSLHGAGGYDVMDHVISFRSYPAPEMSHREKVIYLFPGSQRSYHRLPDHSHTQDEELMTSSRRNSGDYSSQTSLVKL